MPPIFGEQVKCVFVNSTEIQKCYTNDGKFGCSGVGSCVVDVWGEKGKKLTWKSSCGGYAYTVIDGVLDYAKFKCKYECPQIELPFPRKGCKYTPVYDDRGCIVCYDEKCEYECPQRMPPSPDWCKNGKIISGGVDKNNCPLPPKCLIEPAKISETEKGKILSSAKINESSVVIKKAEEGLFIESKNITLKTNETIIVENRKLYIKTKSGNKEILLPPEEASSKINITKIEKIELKEEDSTPIYSIKGTKKQKFFGIIPVDLRIEMKISAETGDTIFIKKPWWSFLTW